MLLNKDLNSQSAPNFLNVSRKRNSDSSHNYDHRKPILKKNASPKFHHPQLNEEEKQQGKQNTHKDKNNTLCTSDVDESPGKTPSQLMKIIQKKKKSIFLELQQLRQSEKSQFSKKNRSNIKKISFRSIGSDSSEQTKLGFKQSKVDIIFSTSNLSESFWNPNEMPDFQLPEKSLKDFRSSDVVEVVLPDSQFSKINLRKTDKKYTLKKSDRIIEEVDETRQDTKDSRVYKVRVFENTASTNANTAQNGFGMISEQSFLKNGNVTSNTLASNKTKSVTSNTIKNQQFADGHSQFITIIKNPPKSKFLNKSSSTELIQHDILSRLPQNSSNGRSEVVLRKSRNRQLHENSMNEEQTITVQRVKFEQRWKEDLFCLVNLYRFFNRLEYQIGKYFTNLNQRIDRYSKLLISEFNGLKYSMLLRAQKQLNEIKSSKAYSFVSSSDISLFNNLIQSYIMKQTQKLGSKIKLNTSIVSENFTEIVFSFLKHTLDYLQPRLNQVMRDLSHSFRTKETLLLQHQTKILSYAFYDVLKRKMNKLQNYNKTQSQRRMTQIIELNQWEQKVPLNQIINRFESLKKDLDRQVILNSKNQ